MTDEEVIIEHDQIAPAPGGADCLLRLSLKKNGKPVPRSKLIIRDTRAGTTKEVMTEEDGNVLIPIVATSSEMLLLVSSPDPFAESWVRLYFVKRGRDDGETDVQGGTGTPVKRNRWGGIPR